MTKVLRTHISNNDNIKGVEGSVLVKLSNFDGVNDPLSGEGAIVDKPGASIPSLFARMIFFRTAFANVTGLGINGTSVYHQLVSQCLDLLEMTFNNKCANIIKFDIAQQINVLANDGMPGHADFSEILQEQTSKFLSGIGQIYLFEDEQGKVIGGTSPYSLAYTSPTWNSGNETRNLLDRDEQFRIYLYRMRKAYLGTGHINITNQYFFEYVDLCEQNDNNTSVNVPDSYSTTQFLFDYKTLQTSENLDVYVDTQIPLCTNPPNAFTSDFFIAPTQPNYQFDAATTPIVVAPGNHPGLKYYGNNIWLPNFIVEDVSDGPLPGGCPPHPSVRSVDFFENDLLALPYPIDEANFGISIPITDGSDGVLYSALLPLKPKFLEFFRPEDIRQMLKIMTSDNDIKLQLSIPIRNVVGDSKGDIVLVKNYSRTENIHYVFKKGLLNGFNIGISPMVKSSSTSLNNYWVMTSVDNPSSINNIELNFYNFATSSPLAVQPGYPKQRGGITGNSAKTWYTNINTFDYIHVKFEHRDSTIGKSFHFGALVIPNFSRPVAGNDELCYGVDFGTTNTHIAYTSTTMLDSKSFSTDTFQSQIAYLNKLTYTRGGAKFDLEDRLRVIKAREFYPNTQSMQYDFPIRTALYAESPINQNTEVYSGASIGFHYSKEFTTIPSYFTSLKWDFLNGNNPASVGRVNVFFREILLMIKNHWLSQPNINHGITPKIMITYPLNNFVQPQTYWEDAYMDIFNVNQQIASTCVDTQVESLAPCVSMIMNNAVPANGLLNIDIGGGTTDIQYYRVDNQLVSHSYYDSIRFAGDDLWGSSFENMPRLQVIKSQENNFTRLIRDKLDADLEITIGKGGADKTKLGNIQLQGKELINCLFRDQGHALSNLLSKIGDDTNNCRLQMFLHYSAIMYHISKKLEKQQLAIPALVNFSGMGSKYLELLFPNNSMDSLTKFTKQLLLEFNPNAVIPPSFKVTMSINPKNVTAEGAALTLYQKATNPNAVPPSPNTFDAIIDLTYSDLISDKTTKAVDEDFRRFLDCFRRIDMNPLNQEKPYIPQMQNSTYEKLLQLGSGSYLNIATVEAQNAQNKSALVQDASLFIWTLKNTLWQI